MRTIEILRSSFATMRMNIRRTILTMIGIVIGIAAVITIMSLGNGFKEKTILTLTNDEEGRQSQTITFQPNDYEEVMSGRVKPFNQSDIDMIMRIEGISEAKIGSANAKQVSMNHTQLQFKDKEAGFESQFLEETKLSMLRGRNLTKLDNLGRMRYCIISMNVVNELFPQESDVLGKVVKIDEVAFTIVGIYQGPESGNGTMTFQMDTDTPKESDVYLPKETSRIILGYSDDTDMMNLTLYFPKEADNTKVLTEKALEMLKEQGSAKDSGEYSFYDMSQIMEGIGQSLNMITYFISAVAAISLLIAGVGVMNMMYISVSERTKEIGIRRSLGATQQNIQLQFLFEGIAITTVGGIIGYILGIGLAMLIAHFLPFDASIDVITALMAVGISVIIGIVFSVFPARAAAQKNVVEILH